MAFQIKPDQDKRNKDISFRRKVYTFIICLVISSCIWVLIKLARDYQEIQKYHIVYTNLPSDKVVVNEPDSVFIVHLKTKGFRIFSNMLFYKPVTINVDVASLLKKRKGSKTDFYIATSDLTQIVEGQIGYSNNVTAINPDTVYFRMEKTFSKKVPVKANIKIKFASQYQLAGDIDCEPKYVKVTGTKEVIDTITFIETAEKNLTNINSNQSFSIDFAKQYYEAKIKIEPAQEIINFPVDKFTEDTLNIPVTVVNNEKNYVVKTFPEQIKVTYLVSLGNYRKVKTNMFSAEADISKAVSEKQNKLKVEIVRFPSFVKLQKMEPQKIEFIIIK
jgi:YbbR domain-containing protein